jgi:hypothetical protein
MALQYPDTTTDYMSQRGIAVTLQPPGKFVLQWGGVQTVHKNKQTLHTISQNKHQLCKKKE